MFRVAAVRLSTASKSAVAASSDPFAVLGLRRSASRDEVKKAYRELAKQHHPDSGAGDATKMEQVNRAYNLLIKDNAYEELHVPEAPSAAGEVPVGAADPESFTRVIMDKQRLATLDPKTERVTPDGKFMYADRDTGAWVTVDRPLTRPEQPRYASHGRFRKETDLFGEIKKKQQELREREESKTFFQRLVVERTSHSLPFDHPILVIIGLAIYIVAMYFIYGRALGKRNNFFLKWDYYAEVREHAAKVRDVYPLFAEECDAVAAAATIVYLAAALKTSADAPEVKPEVTDLNARPPFHLYLLQNAM